MCHMFGLTPMYFAKGATRSLLESSHISLSWKWSGGVGEFSGPRLGFPSQRGTMRQRLRVRGAHTQQSTAPAPETVSLRDAGHRGSPAFQCSGGGGVGRAKRGLAAAFRSKRSAYRSRQRVRSQLDLEPSERARERGAQRGHRRQRRSAPPTPTRPRRARWPPQRRPLRTRWRNHSVENVHVRCRLSSLRCGILQC